MGALSRPFLDPLTEKLNDDFIFAPLRSRFFLCENRAL